MNFSIVVLLLALISQGVVGCGQVYAGELPRVSVLRFNDEGAHIVSGCKGWEEVARYQEQLQSQLEVALVKAGFKVQERREIKELYNSEYNLVNSRRKNRPNKGAFKSAQFTIAGALTEFGLCTQSQGNGVQLGGVLGLLGVPGSSNIELAKGEVRSKVGLVAQVIDVETGEDIGAFEASAEAKSSASELGVSVMGIGGHHTESSKSVAEEASKEAINQIVAQIKAHFQNRTQMSSN
jgi:curli biogenesis system outer membrane secretion channel CsgG